MDIFKLPVHPAADIPPMLDDDKLELLAESIKQDGLQQPIVVADVDGEMMLIDGRNRRKACEMAGVEPDIHKLNGADPMVTILTSNNRRDGTVGQKAAQVVLQVKFSNLEKWQGQEALAATAGIAKGRIGEAFTISEYKPHLLKKIVHEGYPFSKAYKEAQEEKRNLEQGSEGMKWLKKHDPDLAKRVIAEADMEGGLHVQDAIDMVNGRLEREEGEKRNKVASVMHGLKQAVAGTTAFAAGDALEEASKLVREHAFCMEERDRYFSADDWTRLKTLRKEFAAGAAQIDKFIKTMES